MSELYLESQKTYNGRYMYLSCTQETVREENKSIVHWTLTVTGGASNYYTTGPTTITIDGQIVYYAPKVYYNAPEFPASKGSVSGTLDVYHDSEGKKTVECSIKTAIYDGVMRENKATWALDAIPQASTVQLAADCFIGSECTVLVDRKSNNYTHTIAFCTPDLEGFLCADGAISQEPVKLEATTIPFKVPTYLYNRIPNDQKIECSFICETWMGDVQIGDAQKYPFFAYCREEECAPLVNGIVVDCNETTLALTEDENILVRYFSCARCEIDATSREGASIDKKQVNSTEMNEAQIEIPNVETGSFLFKATDTRGFTREYLVENELVPYQKLTLAATGKRVSAGSDQVQVTVSGKAFTGSFGAQDNDVRVFCYLGTTLLAELEVTPTEDGYTAQGTVELSYKSACLLQVIAEDKLMHATFSVQIPPGTPVFDWGKNDFNFNVPVKINGNLHVTGSLTIDTEEEAVVADYMVEQGAESMGDNGTWYWEKWSNGKAVCWGTRNYGDIDVTTAWGSNGWYESAGLTQNFPAGLFIAEPDDLHIDVAKAGNGVIVSKGWNSDISATNTGTFSIVRISKMTVKQVYLSFKAIGRWKS